MLTLPRDSALRKLIPLWRGCWAYFPAALAGVAKRSLQMNEQHNKGQPMHHDRKKSADHMDCLSRHQSDLGDALAQLDRAGTLETYQHDELVEFILTEADAMAWRSLALSQELHERLDGAPLAPAARE